MTEYEYDKLGQLIEVTDPTGDEDNKIKVKYDSLQQKIETDDPDMGDWTYAYDDLGRLIEQIDAKYNKVKFYYDYGGGVDDELGRLIKKEIYDSPNDDGASYNLTETVTFTYDNYYDDGTGHYVHDDGYPGHKGLLYKVEVNRSGAIDSIEKGYDSRGREVITTYDLSVNGEDYTIENDYDDADRITYINYPGNYAEIQYNYDSVGHLESVESLSGVPDGPVTFYSVQEFDEFGRAVDIDYGNGVTFNYEYYTGSERLKRIYSYGAADLQDLTYTYDIVSNITSITDAEYTSGSLSSTLSDVEYDDLYRVTEVTSTALGTKSYSYDEIGNILVNEEFGSSTYTYEGTSGITHAQPHAVTHIGGGAQKYEYDACGNMVKRDNQTLAYDELNRLIAVSDTAGLDVEFGYGDGNTRLYKKVDDDVFQIWIGNLYEEKGDNILCHVYAGGKLICTFEPQDSWTKLTEKYPVLAGISDFSGKAYFILFEEGRTPLTLMSAGILIGLCYSLRIRKRRGMYVFYFVKTRHNTICLMLIVSMMVLTTPRMAVADPVYDNPVFYYYHCDHLSSTSIMTDADGDLVQHYNYSAFGAEIATGDDEAFSVTNRYTGQQLDEETGLYYYSSRYYDAELARFVQADPVVPEAGSSQALNRYSYCINNPLKYIDPTGNVMMYPSSYNDYGFGSWGTSAVSGGFYNSFSYLTPSFSDFLSFPSYMGCSSSSYSPSSYSPLSFLATPSLGSYYKYLGFNFDMPNVAAQFSNLHQITTPAYYDILPYSFYQLKLQGYAYTLEEEWFLEMYFGKFHAQDYEKSCITATGTNFLNLGGIGITERQMRGIYSNLKDSSWNSYGVPSHRKDILKDIARKRFKITWEGNADADRAFELARTTPVGCGFERGGPFHAVILYKYSKGTCVVMDPAPAYTGHFRFMSEAEFRSDYIPNQTIFYSESINNDFSVYIDN